MERENLKREIFNLKHGKKIDTLKRFGGKARNWAEGYSAAMNTSKKKQKKRRNNYTNSSLF